MIFGRLQSALFISAISIGVFGACISNPFGDDDISGGNRTIRGQVQLSEGFEPEDVYVWLEGINMATRTDEEGQFQLDLLPPEAQNSGGGLSGVFNVYFYVANYNLVSKPVAVRAGNFVFSNGELNSKGVFQQPIFMTQSLKMTVELQPDRIDLSSSGSLLSAVTTLEAVRENISVFWPLSTDRYLAPLLFRNKDTGEFFVLETVFAGIENSDFLTIQDSPRDRTMIASIEPGELTAGHYEVRPFLFVLNEEIPQELIHSIVDDMEKIESTYFDIPFKKVSDELVVTD